MHATCFSSCQQLDWATGPGRLARPACHTAVGLPWDSRVSPAAFRPATRVVNWGLVSTGESARKVQPGKVLYVAACCRVRPAAEAPGRAEKGGCQLMSA